MRCEIYMDEQGTERPKLGVNTGNRGKGRPKGVPNKTNALLKDAILKAAENAGGKEGMVGYLTTQAIVNPGPFMSLLGKVLPTQVTGEGGDPIKTEEVGAGAKLAALLEKIAERSREAG